MTDKFEKMTETDQKMTDRVCHLSLERLHFSEIAFFVCCLLFLSYVRFCDLRQFPLKYYVGFFC